MTVQSLEKSKHWTKGNDEDEHDCDDDSKDLQYKNTIWEECMSLGN
jgi:hypothetical protein